MENFDKKILSKYAELKAVEKHAKTCIAELGPAIKEAMSSAYADKIDSEFGTFTLKPVPVWKYSSRVEELEAEVDKQKAQEKADGTAVAENRVDLVFKAAKEKE